MSYDVFSGKEVTFWGSVDVHFPIYGVKRPKHRHVGGMNRHFQAKRAKYSKFHIIETTA